MRELWRIAACLAIALSAYCVLAVRAPVKPGRISRPTPSATENAPPLEPLSAPSLRDGYVCLIRGRDWLRTIPDYTAVFRKQERVGDVLHEPDTIDLKLRHQPFSVAMRWREDGRVVYYRDGSNGNRMTVRMGGWKGRLGWIHLDPHATLAMTEARYAVTDVGLLRLTEQLLERFEPYLDQTVDVSCAWLPDEQVGGRPCRVFTVEYRSAAVNPDYRRTVVWLDKEWSVPLAVQNFDWYRDDPSNPEGLVEHYVYEGLQLEGGLVEADFTVDGQPPAGREVARQP
jgi:hypothetical protein